MNLELDISDINLYANKNFARLLTDRIRTIISYGSRDSAKSYSFAQKVVYHMLTEKYCHPVLMRKIGSDIKDSQYATIISVISDWQLDAYFYCIKSPLEIKCLLNGNTAIARGLDKPTKLKSIKDPTIVWIEEANEITYEDYMQTMMSIRSNVKGVLLQMLMSFNPDDESSWINKFFFPPKVSYETEDGLFDWVESTQKNTIILHSCYLTNRYCAPANKEFYDNLKYVDETVYKTSALGLWGQIDESIIFNEIYEADKFPEEDERKFYGIGLDYGFTNHPTAAIECCIAHGAIYLHELFYKKGLFNVTDDSEKMSIDKEFKRCGIGSNDEIYPDIAEPKSIAELEEKGYSMNKPPGGKDPIIIGINRLQSYKIYIVNSPNLKKEARNYKYKRDKNGEITPIPIDAFNHGWDAVRYWLKGAVEQYSDIVVTRLC